MLPELPEVPSWPEISWQYTEGKYWLTESDIDKVLDFLENKIPQYKYEIEQYQKQIDIILAGLK